MNGVCSKLREIKNYVLRYCYNCVIVWQRKINQSRIYILVKLQQLNQLHKSRLIDFSLKFNVDFNAQI